MPDEHLTPPATGVHNPYADDEAGTPLAPSPVETPGPSVTPPALPESETERREWADANAPEAGIVAREEAAAAAEARSIGGAAPSSNVDDPAMDPVYQAGGGEQEGFEQAEADLIENATHGDQLGNPLRDAFLPEYESDRSSAVYGGADDEPVTEVTRDPDTDDFDDPGAGPGLAADRGS
jgi:hypothetical protein